MATSEIHTPLSPQAGALQYAAAGTPLFAAGTERAARPVQSRLKLAVANAQSSARQAAQVTPSLSCQQCLALSFFFDGTGNNLEADVGTLQQSNVARLFESHPQNDPVLGRYAFYIPGLGTYFKEIGDPGFTKRGRGMGHKGQARLDWAFEQFDKVVKDAEARAANPTNKIVFIKVSVFGFSRGATAARAFVRDLQARCRQADGQWRLKRGGYPVEVIFLGLFDTVASVGLALSTNNTPAPTIAGLYSIDTTLNIRAASPIFGVKALAFGEPGADPSPGSYDGHATWADGLRVPAPDFVKRCVHMVAGHEIRNSFPVDSVLDGRQYAGGVTEMVYPGVHSDVGGGYQPGEGARSEHYGEMLSLIPLRVMHASAREAGVPLYSIAALMNERELVKKSFALDEASAAKFAELNRVWGRYMQAAGSGGRDLGKELLAHNAWYLRWRFFNARRNRAAGGNGPDNRAIAKREPGFAAERKRMTQGVEARRVRLEQAEKELDRAETAQRTATYNRARFGVSINPNVPARVQRAQTQVKSAKDAYLRDKAQLDTYANDSELAANLNAYDRQLIEDAEAIVSHQRKNPQLKLRPHYANLVEAYTRYFVQGAQLDTDIAAFFDRYVHDSLGGFAADSTLPSDPRVVYAGGDNKIRYAEAADPPSRTMSSAA